MMDIKRALGTTLNKKKVTDCVGLQFTALDHLLQMGMDGQNSFES